MSVIGQWKRHRYRVAFREGKMLGKSTTIDFGL
jgi:hypothetical protein